MLLTNNSMPDIDYVVQQCDRFTHSQKASHGASFKHIIRYFQGKKGMGLIILPRKTLQVECHVDADFYGLWNVEHEQDPACLESRTR